ncbi:MAG TPA: hypothetical protein VIA06_18305 [Candidatus Dormibacteraeota bacterium]|jgi:hypothetical protein|nr:hypothetical protein [Candidatus Dormibacteraeota bacterium]
MPFWSRRRPAAEPDTGSTPLADIAGLPDISGMIEVAGRLGLGTGTPKRAADGTYQGAWVRSLRERKKETGAWTILSWGPDQSHAQRVQIARSGPTGTIRSDEVMAYMFEVLGALLPTDQLDAAGQWIATHPRGGITNLGATHLILAASSESDAERLDLTVRFAEERAATGSEPDLQMTSPVTTTAVLAVGSAEGMADGGAMQMGERSQHTLRGKAEVGRPIPQITYLAFDAENVGLLQVTWFYPENRQLEADEAWAFLQRTMEALLPADGLTDALALIHERRFGQALMPGGAVALIEQHRSPTRSIGWVWSLVAEG